MKGEDGKTVMTENSPKVLLEQGYCAGMSDSYRLDFCFPILLLILYLG
jgi:hypothetical protein